MGNDPSNYADPTGTCTGTIICNKDGSSGSSQGIPTIKVVFRQASNLGQDGTESDPGTSGSKPSDVPDKSEETEQRKEPEQKKEQDADKKKTPLTPEERWKKAVEKANMQNNWENAAQESARMGNWAGYNEFMKHAAQAEREYMELLYGKRPAQSDFPPSRSPVPGENK